MKIFPITGRNLRINAETKENLNSLMKTMDDMTVHNIYNNGCSFSTTYNIGAKLNNNAIYHDGIPGEVTGISIIDFNNKRYTIYNATGEIVPEKESLMNKIFGISKKTIKGISTLINNIKENFDNPEIVRKQKIGFEGFTKKGFDRLKPYL